MPEVSVFISYRRADTSADAGRLYDALRRRIGRERVFMDVDSLRPGEDWVESVEDAVSRCDVLLALIGSEWTNVQDDEGNRRLEDEFDRVRLEIEAALKADKHVIPVLFEDASMPRAAVLPESLRPILRRHAIRMSHASFDGDVRVLMRALNVIARTREATDGVPPSTSAASPAVSTPSPAPPEVEQQPQPARFDSNQSEAHAVPPPRVVSTQTPEAVPTVASPAAHVSGEATPSPNRVGANVRTLALVGAIFLTVVSVLGIVGSLATRSGGIGALVFWLIVGTISALVARALWRPRGSIPSPGSNAHGVNVAYPARTTFAPQVVVAQSGGWAWPTPDQSDPRRIPLAAGLPLRVLDDRRDWLLAESESGWQGWTRWAYLARDDFHAPAGSTQ